MAEPRNPNVFDPPTPHELSLHLERNPAAQGVAWQARLPLIALVLVLISFMLIGNPGFALLPLLAMMGLMAYLSSRARAGVELQQRVTRAWELAMIRRYREAMGQAWELLPACRTQPELHGRIVTIIAHILGELGQDDAADVAYCYLLDKLPSGHPLSLRLRVQRATAALGADRLADADDALRKLRGSVESANDPSLAASYRLAKLLQDVRTGHFADAIEQADQTAAAIQPLGIEAGYGHGLLALCYHQLAQHDPHADTDQRRQLADLAKQWWNKATLLIPTSALLHRHPDLRLLPATIDNPSPDHANQDDLNQDDPTQDPPTTL